MDQELTLKGGVAEIGGKVGVCIIRGDEDFLSFQYSNCFLASAGKSDGAGDGLGSKVALMLSDQSFSCDVSFNSSVASQSS